MLKKSLAMFVILTVILTMALPVAAVPTGTVGKFTPVIDGEKDEAYGQSYSMNIFEQDNATKGEGWYSTSGDMATVGDANIWFLWDDSFLYAYVDVLLPEVLNRDDDYIKDDPNPWEANSIELWVLYTDLDMDADRLKTSVEPIHNRTWGDGPYFEDVEPGTKKIAKMTSTGYCGEFAIAIPAEYLKDKNNIKFTLQVNHYDGNGTIPFGQQIQGSGDQGVDLAPVITLGAPIVIAAPEPEPEPVVEVEAVAEVAPVEAAPVAQVEVAPVAAPVTGDSLAIVMLLAAVAFAGIVTVKKTQRVK